MQMYGAAERSFLSFKSPKKILCLWRVFIVRDGFCFQREKVTAIDSVFLMSCCLVAKSYPILVQPHGPGSSVQGISQARTLEWFAISFSRGSSPPRDGTCISNIGRGIIHCWATREIPRNWQLLQTGLSIHQWGWKRLKYLPAHHSKAHLLQEQILP